MARAKVDFEFPKKAVLWRLHKAVAENEIIAFTPERASLEVGLSTDLGRLAIDELEQGGYCQTSTEEEWGEHPITGMEHMENVTYVKITRDGITEVEGWSDDYHDTVVSRIRESESTISTEATVLKRDSDGLIDLPLDIENSNGSKVPASDRIVTTKDNAEAHEKAVKAVEDFAKEAAESNEFPALFDNPDDSRVALDEINAGLKLLKKARVRVQVVKELIVKHLEMVVAGRMGDAMLGALAAEALNKILAFLGG